MQKIRIGDRWVGEGEPCFIIAEAGVNHNGDINLAKRLIDVAKEAGADAVKFQTFKAEEVVIKSAKKAKYQAIATGEEESQFKMIKSLELSESDFKKLFDYTQDKGILFLSTPDDMGSVDLLNRLDITAFKISSGEITNFSLLRYIAQEAKPIILSTGMSTLEEVKKALEIIKQQGAKDIILLHCVTAYPAKIKDMNLKTMITLRDTFRLPVGLSDHSLGISIPIAAVALGASVIEKHFTLDKSLPGPDHTVSLEPQELKEMVKAIRQVEAALGDGIKRPTKSEEENKDLVRRSIVAKVDIPKGAIITEKMLAIKRPGTGIQPRYIDKVVGRKAKQNIKPDEIISWKKI